MKTIIYFAIFIMINMACTSQNIENKWQVKESNLKDVGYFNEVYSGLIFKFEANNKLVIIRGQEKFYGSYKITNKNYLTMDFSIIYKDVEEIVSTSFVIEFANKNTLILHQNKKTDKDYMKLIKS